MATLDFGLLCNSAMEQNGLVSLLGGGLDRVVAPQLPIQVVLTFVARIAWDDAELGSPHALRLVVRHVDGEQLARLEGGVIAARDPKMPKSQPVGSLVILALPLDIRRVGDYSVALAIDGDILKELPLVAETALPEL